MIQRFPESLVEPGQIRCPDELPEVTGSDRLVAGQYPHAEGEAVVLGAELVHPVLRHGAFAFADLQPDIRVLPEALGARVRGDEVENGVTDLRDNVDGDLFGHG